MGSGLDFLFDEEPLEKHPWMGSKRFVLVTVDNLTECIDACINGVNKRFSLDLETTGIDNRVFNGETKDKIVGVCLSGDGITGWYIPLRHEKGAEHNVPFMTFDREFRRLMAAVDEGRVVAVFHNAKFDQEFLEFNGRKPYGNWDVPKHWEDTLILAYLRHSRARRKSLKVLSAAPTDDPTPEQVSQVGGRGLGMKMYELSDLFPKPERGQTVQYDYSKLDPSAEGPLIYGCSDGICTWLLADLLIPEVLHPKKHSYDQRYIYVVEKLCVTATRWMERNLIQTDPDKVMELIRLGQQEWFDSVMEVYRAASEILGRDVMPGYYKVLQHGSPENGAGKFVPDDPLTLLPQQVEWAKSREKIYYPNPPMMAETRGKKWPYIYDVNAPQQLGKMFEEMVVPGLKYTEKSKQVMTAKAELERVINEAEDRFPFMGLIKRFRETNKALSSYLFPMLEDVDPSNHTMRINFNAHKVDTGRFSTPAKERELESAKTKHIAGWPEINLQSMPATYDPKRPACMTRLRECVVARPGYFIVAIDFSGEELRLVTNLSGEPKWLDEFFHCSSCNRKFPQGTPGTTPPPPPARCPNCGSDKIGDLHTLTALSIYGADATQRADWKALRGNGKCVHSDTMVWMDNVPVPIRSLLTDPNIGFTPYGGSTKGPEGDALPVLEVYHGEQELFHVVTNRGVVTCSAQHLFQTRNGDLVSIERGLEKGVVLADPPPVTLEDRVFPDVPCKPHSQVPATWIKTSPAHAYFSGLYMGDGSASSSGASICHGHTAKTDPMGFPYADWQDVLVAACEDVGIIPVRRKKKVYLGSRQVMRWMSGLGLVDASTRTLRIPSWVWGAGREGLLQFLGGLIDTDGYVGAKDHSAWICTKDYIFAGQIAEALRLVGCTPSVQPSWNKTYKRWYLVIGAKRNDSAILRPYVRHPEKNKRLYTEAVRTVYYANKVKLVVPAGRQPCFDLHIDSEDHLYLTNGLITHNSVNFALCYGGGGNAVVRACSVDKNEGWRIKNTFDGTYLGLKTWWAGQHRFAHEYGFVLTAFGRIYPVPDIGSSERMWVEKAKRNAVNGPIQGCQVYESRVWTDQGAIQIGELWGRHRDQRGKFQAWTGTRWSPARVLYSGMKREVHTILSSGNVCKTSPDHRFRVFDQGKLGWRQQEELRPQDWVVCDAAVLDLPPPVYTCQIPSGHYSYNSKGFALNGNSQILWEFLGLVYGDGTIGAQHFYIHVGGPDAERQATIYCTAINTLGVDAHVRKAPRGEKERHKLPMWQVVVHNRAFRDFCREHLGVMDANTYSKRFPSAIWGESAEHRAAFLRGYFSADGCANVAEAVDVRSTNPELLMDTHKLLRSLGIRSTVRLDSKRVSIKDRVAYRDRVGFLVPEKSNRLAAIEANPWTGQWHALPPDFIKRIGEVVYSSSIYAALPRPEKSAVLRLLVGSGSKPQCLRYLARVPPAEVPFEVTTLLQYDYEQVVGVDDTGEQVEMFDIEVFDDEHAFVCDGVIVHNSGADIIKIAMGAVYKECKKRGWLDLVKMVATMHDELVFEMHGSVIEEAIAVLTPIMTSNSMITGKKWPVPMTTDCEIGKDWTVSWGLNAMRYREVRFDGNKKVKEPRKPGREDFIDDDYAYEKALVAYPAKKAVWEAMPDSWPEELRVCFTNLGFDDGGAVQSPPSSPPAPASTHPPLSAEILPQEVRGPESSPEGTRTDQDPVNVAYQEAQEWAGESPTPFKPPPALRSGDTYDFQLKGNLTPGMCANLAEVILTCQNGGTKKLRLLLPDGTVLSGWSDKDCFVNHSLFYALAYSKGL